MSEFPMLFSIYCSFKILFPFVLISSLSGLALLKIWGRRFYVPPDIIELRPSVKRLSINYAVLSTCYQHVQDKCSMCVIKFIICRPVEVVIVAAALATCYLYTEQVCIVYTYHHSTGRQRPMQRRCLQHIKKIRFYLTDSVLTGPTIVFHQPSSALTAASGRHS